MNVVGVQLDANEDAGLLVVNVIGETIGKVAGFISGQNAGLQFAVIERGGTVDLGANPQY